MSALPHLQVAHRLWWIHTSNDVLLGLEQKKHAISGTVVCNVDFYFFLPMLPTWCCVLAPFGVIAVLIAAEYHLHQDWELIGNGWGF